MAEGFTPGPWEVSKLGNGLHILGDRRPGSAQVVATVGGSSQVNLEANARLIAAAPELFELLVAAEADPEITLRLQDRVRHVNLAELLARVQGEG